MATLKYSGMTYESPGRKDREKWDVLSDTSSSVDQTPPSFSRRSSAFRTHCLGRRDSCEPDDFYRNADESGLEKLKLGKNRSGEVPYTAHSSRSLPRPCEMKSSSLPASARAGLSAMLCVDAVDRSFSPSLPFVLQVSAEDLAGQLTLMDLPVFRAIQPEELTSCGWAKPNKLQVSPNVVAMTRRFNHVVFWTVQEILNCPSVRQRAEVLSSFIRIAKKLHEMSNLHSQFAVLSALESAAIHQLKKTWNALPRKDVQLFEKLKELFSSENNWEKLRQHMETLKLPCIPYLGLFLTDLTYIDYVHPHSGGLESQQRQLKMNNLLRILSNYQHSDYSHIEAKPSIQQYLQSEGYMEEFRAFVENDQYKLSLQLEPRTPPASQRSNNSSSSSKQAVSEMSSALGKLHLSPGKHGTELPASKSSGESSLSNKFVPGHRKAQSLGNNVFGYHSSDLSEFRSQGSSRNSLINPGFDPSVRNLLDDSVIVPSGSQEFHFEQSPRRLSGSHSLNGLDSPVPPPPVRYCCIQGCLRRKTLLKDGKRPAVSSWQRYWVQLSGPYLLFYSPKTLRGTDRSNFHRDFCKTLCITGCTVDYYHGSRYQDAILVTNPVKGDSYKFRVISCNAVEDWLLYLRAASRTESEPPSNLISFE